MREKIRKAIQYLLSAVELWEVTTATGNSFHNLFPKTVFRILFKIWLWIYGFIIFTKYKATSLLCSWLQIECFSSPETSHLKKAVANPGNSVPPDSTTSLNTRKILPLPWAPLRLLPSVPSKAQPHFCGWLASAVSQEKEKATIFFSTSHHFPASAPAATCGTMTLFIAQAWLRINH